MTSETARPRALLTRPLLLIALATLALNDHLFKGACPGLLTGKLSDVAGLFVFPLALWASLDLVSTRPLQARVLTAIALLTGVAFTLIKTSAVVRALYLLPYAWAGVSAAVAPDPTDLLCLPLLAVAVAYGRWHLRATPPRPLVPRLTRSAVAGGFLLATVATSAIPLHQERFVLAPGDRAQVAEVDSRVVITGLEVHYTHGLPGLFWNDDPSVGASVWLRCPPAVRPRAVDAQGSRVLLGDGVWGARGEAAIYKSDEAWSVYVPLEQIDAGFWNARALNPVRLVIDLTDGTRVEVAGTLRGLPLVYPAYLARGEALLAARSFSEALALYASLLERGVGHLSRDAALLGRAKALIGLGQTQRAYQDLISISGYSTLPLEASALALELRPNDEAALWQRCRYYQGHGQADLPAGLAAATAYLDAHPQGVCAQSVRFQKARLEHLLARQGDLDRDPKEE